MAFLAPVAVGIGSSLLGGLFGSAAGPSIDVHKEISDPMAGVAGQRSTAQINKLNTMDQGAFRNAQLGQLGYLQQQAMGQGPSIAQMQADRAAQTGAAQQMSGALAIGGPNAGLARRQALSNTAGLQGDIAGQAMQARLQEIQNANQMLSAATQSGRSSDLGSQQLAANYEQLLADSALRAQAQKADLLKANLAAKEKSGAGFTSAIAGGLSAMGPLFGGGGGAGSGGRGVTGPGQSMMG